MELPSNLEALARLIGSWSGPGEGAYPTSRSFSYQETITFTCNGKPFLEYVQRTKSPDGQPMHTETGYLRHSGDGHVEFVLAQPTGQVEIGVGTWAAQEDGSVTIVAEGTVMNTPTAKTVNRMIRRLRFGDGVLTYEIEMEAVGQPMTLHLRSALELIA